MKYVRQIAALAMAFVVSGMLVAGPAQAGRKTPEQVVSNWYRLVLELVRHTPTYSPPGTWCRWPVSSTA